MSQSIKLSSFPVQENLCFSNDEISMGLGTCKSSVKQRSVEGLGPYSQFYSSLASSTRLVHYETMKTAFHFLQKNTFKIIVEYTVYMM